MFKFNTTGKRQLKIVTPPLAPKEPRGEVSPFHSSFNPDVKSNHHSGLAQNFHNYNKYSELY